MGDLGRSFVEALAQKDFGRMREVLHPDVDFRGLTPKRNWEATSSQQAIDEILRSWFEESDQITETVNVERDAVVDRERVAYRFRVTNPDGDFVVEQTAYYAPREDQIGWMRVVCSGFRPLD